MKIPKNAAEVKAALKKIKRDPNADTYILRSVVKDKEGKVACAFETLCTFANGSCDVLSQHAFQFWVLCCDPMKQKFDEIESEFDENETVSRNGFTMTAEHWSIGCSEPIA